MHELKGKGTVVDCHDTEIRKMALQLNEQSSRLLSAGEQRRAGGNRCSSVGWSLGSSWSQAGLSRSHTGAKCHRGTKPAGTGSSSGAAPQESGGWKNQEAQQPGSANPLLPFAWRESRPSLPCLCQGRPRFAARDKLPAGAPEPGMQRGGRQSPGPTRPTPRGAPRSRTDHCPAARTSSFLPFPSFLPPSFSPSGLTPPPPGPPWHRRRPARGPPRPTAQAPGGPVRGGRGGPVRGGGRGPSPSGAPPTRPQQQQQI